MGDIKHLKSQIVRDLEEAGRKSLYVADANESDPRYKAYGVRAPALREILKKHRPAIRQLELGRQIKLATQMVESGFGEQQSVGLFILEPHSDYYIPERFGELDRLVGCLHGWSKVDGFTGSLLRDVLFNHPKKFPLLVEKWNQDSDLWLRRASVVLFARKVAKSGLFNDFALTMCDSLKHAPEDLVRKGVGWALKDLMRSDKKRVLDYVFKLRQQNISGTITSYAIRDLKGQERADFLARK
ncbi:DNA alkylation repair protein [Rubellicoccus peritrichatus]|uniref:DNA alkylation repair protein n=1 Tax=Rubellicoccus peritrichatus TaxID=3080537 RepID=A0AAQ3QV44_9BACT|nr:DNA alkylation repair protein [Puniceicoccus sp. CR14]WOO41133.1 DNA alkylation repair protein [Puniceicoccus sp. CR14]